MEWLLLTLLAFLGFGFQDFFYKVASSKRCNSYLLTFSFLLTVTLISFIFCLFQGLSLTSTLLFLGMTNGILFSLTTLSRLESLKELPASIVFTIIRMSLILVVVWALVFLRETLNFRSLLGIIFAFLAIYLLKGEKK